LDLQKGVEMAKETTLYPGWKDSRGTVFHANDPRLIGAGNPPTDQAWANAHPGQGTIPMRQVLVSVDSQGYAIEHKEGV